MKTLKFALASALIALSFNSFAGVCEPCGTSGILNDSIIAAGTEMTQDVKVNELLQKMTVAVQQQVITTTATNSKKQKHEKRKASK